MNDLTARPVADPPAELPPAPPGRAPLPVQLIVLGVIIVPLLGLAAVPFFLWGWGFSWIDMGLLLGMYLLTAMGLTVGFHRLITHRSFETYEWVRFTLAAVGAMAVQGSMLQWVALHRRHHQHSDTPEDPHTPHHSGRGVRGVLRGAWHAQTLAARDRRSGLSGRRCCERRWCGDTAGRRARRCSIRAATGTSRSLPAKPTRM